MKRKGAMVTESVARIEWKTSNQKKKSRKKESKRTNGNKKRHAPQSIVM